MTDSLPSDDRVRRLEVALELVWTLHVRKHMHLGLERASGIEQHCIPCICAAALGRGVDAESVDTDYLFDILTGLQQDSKHE